MGIFALVRPELGEEPTCPSTLIVCRYWRELVLPIPQFWANLIARRTNLHEATHSRRAAIRSALAHTRELALTVFWVGLEGRAMKFFSLYLHNVVSITVYVDFSDVTLLNQLLTDERLSRLAGLSINLIPNSTWSIDRQEPPTGWIPALRSVTLSRLNTLKIPRIHLNVEAESPSLRHLCLTTCACHFRIQDSTRLLDALAHLPNLATLSLLHALPSCAHASLSDPPKQVVKLPRLDMLTIKDGPWDAYGLLRCLEYPSQASLCLSFETSDGGCCKGTFPFIHRPFVPVHEMDTNYDVIIDDTTTLLRVQASTHGQARVRVDVPQLSDSGWKRCTDVLPLFPFETVTTLTLQGDDIYGHVEHLDAILKTFPQLLYLSDQSLDGRCGLLHFLSRRIDRHKRAVPVRCPRLESLSFVIEPYAPWNYRTDAVTGSWGDPQQYPWSILPGDDPSIGEDRHANPSNRYRAVAIKLLGRMMAWVCEERAPDCAPLKTISIGVHPDFLDQDGSLLSWYTHQFAT
ncbi:hypothetical protein BD310DRAFT_929640 [Dichomitus squalens]|uniref:F-box domain-containing protein n=1 Tax=Dichomitus squalens TaxID=114155 RepID=A0A4Q9PS67_9APHY|nr:hypothetical protein BD310DRAFT_929640 [Dichomitus squalens]